MQLPVKEVNSHKGEKGRILVVGGSQKYYGAPILAALGAEKAGADLITIFLPKEHISVAKTNSLNFFVNSFVEENFGYEDIRAIIDAASEQHVLIIGNGLGKDEETQAAIVEILKNIRIPIILDAEALFPEVIKVKKVDQDWIVTPHRGEFKRLFEVDFSTEHAKRSAVQHTLTICTKGKIDYICNNQKEYENDTGCPEMRVGGSGDVLAGIIASYKAQGMDSFSACCSATYYYGRAGESLQKIRNSFSAQELAEYYPTNLAEIRSA
jgi:NAD(P)H-hydrate epimerase